MEKHRWEESEKRREEKRREEKRREEKKIEDQRRERVRRKKMQARKKGRKVAQLCVFPMICGSGGSKSRLAKAAGAEPSGQMREAYFQVQMYKTPHVRTTFGSWDVQKVHAVVARSTFPSLHVQDTPGSEHF